MRKNTKYVGAFTGIDCTVSRFWSVVASLNSKQQSELLRFVVVNVLRRWALPASIHPLPFNVWAFCATVTSSRRPVRAFIHSSCLRIADERAALVRYSCDTVLVLLAISIFFAGRTCFSCYFITPIEIGHGRFRERMRPTTNSKG